MDYRDNRQRWAESHQVVHFYAGQWCTFTPANPRHHARRTHGASFTSDSPRQRFCLALDLGIERCSEAVPLGLEQFDQTRAGSPDNDWQCDKRVLP